MRDYLAAIRERVVVFDGSMGATLEQYDLSLERDYRLPGPRARGARAQPARRDRRPARAMVAVGAEVVETDTFQASRLKLEEWGLERRTRTRSTARRRRSRARRSASSASWPARSAPPGSCPPPTTRRSAGSASASSWPSSRSRRARLVDGGADLLIIETAQDILEVKAAIFGAREAFQATGRAVPIQASVSLLPNGGTMLLGTDINAVLATLEALKVDAIGLNCSTGPEDMRDAIRFLGEFSLRARALHPERRHPAPGAERRDDLPRGAGPAGRHARRVRRPLRRVDRRRLLRHDDGAHRRDRRARRRRQGRRRGPRRARRTSPR